MLYNIISQEQQEEFIYRLLEEEDFVAFVAMRKEAFRNEPEAFGSDYLTYSATHMIDKEHFFEKVLNYPFSFVLGSFTLDNVLIGMVGFSCHTSPKRRHKAIMWGMYVKPEYRYHGIGNHLVEIITLSAKEDARCEQLLITVSPPESFAHKFYEENGFVRYGVEYRALKLDDEYVDEVLMMKIL